MSKQYHHGNLKEELIYNGLVLLNNEGAEGFSMRKVASMCGVSHNAPYKHFKNKDEFIEAIAKEVWAKFRTSLEQVAMRYAKKRKLEAADMGKAYVTFMVENPEYLKFMFLSNNTRPVKIVDNKLPDDKDGAFGVFQGYAENVLADMDIDPKLFMKSTILMWSTVHGLATLIANNAIQYEGDIKELIDILFDSEGLPERK